MKALAEKNKLIPTEAIRELTKGSFEHLSFRLDDAISENSELFSKNGEVAKIATFGDRVIVGTEDGKYFSSIYEDVDGKITLHPPQAVDVPVVDGTNIDNYINTFTMKVVDSIINGDIESQKEGILALASLSESIETEFDRSLDELVREIVHSRNEWKIAYTQQRESIKNVVSDLVELIEKNEIEAKYIPLYDGTIPEEKFPSYLDMIRKDLGVVAARLSAVEERTEKAYLPFVEMVKKAELSKDEKSTVEQFIKFSDGFSAEIHDLREHVALAIKHENCAMCIGQIHDTIAESLTDYELAGSFIERMASKFLESE